MVRDLPELRCFGPGFGFVSEAVKHATLRDATALVHASLFEGFGLPVVEAFGHGTPVIASTRAALAEVVGDAALVVDPTDVDAIAAAMIRIHADSALRAALGARGRERAATMTPRTSAAAWERLHADLIARRSPPR